MATLDFNHPIAPEDTYSVAGKQLKFDSADDIKPYLEEMAKVPHLKKIDFSGNTIGIEASEALAKAIRAHGSEIEEVNFSDFYTSRLNTEIPQSLEYLLPALLTLPKLSVLNLSDNAFGLQTIDPIEKFLPDAVALEHLVLSNNGMGPYAGARIGKALFKLAHNKKKHYKDAEQVRHLKTFICGRNRLENGSTDYLSLGLAANDQLETIRLYQNGIRPQGVSKLIRNALAGLKHLKHLDLQDNTITKASSEDIAATLGASKWVNLKELNLNDALLQKQGGYLILKALLDGKPHPELTALRLQFNELDEKSLEILPLLIEKNLPNLQVLELNGNVFDEESKHLVAINEIFDKRGFGELDELDELEEPDSEEEDEDSEEEEEEEEAEAFDPQAAADELLKELQSETKEDKEEEDLVAKLESTHIA